MKLSQNNKKKIDIWGIFLLLPNSTQKTKKNPDNASVQSVPPRRWRAASLWTAASHPLESTSGQDSSDVSTLCLCRGRGRLKLPVTIWLPSGSLSLSLSRSPFFFSSFLFGSISSAPDRPSCWRPLAARQTLWGRRGSLARPALAFFFQNVTEIWTKLWLGKAWEQHTHTHAGVFTPNFSSEKLSHLVTDVLIYTFSPKRAFIPYFGC